MEALFAVLMFIVLAWIVLKIFAVLFHVSIFMIALPFKILGVILALLLVPFIAVPLGLFAGLAGLLLIPFAIAVPLLPLIIIGLGIWLLIKNA